MYQYLVTLKKLGNVIRTLSVFADNGTQAIELVESMLDIKPPRVCVDNSTGKMFVAGWSGIEFCAKRVSVA